MSFALKLITAPATEPVTAAEAKARLQVTVTDMDTDIGTLISECRAACEDEVQRAFVTQTWSLYLDDFPRGREIELPRPPLSSVTWVKYYDTSAVQQTLSSSAYYVTTGAEPGKIVLKESESWPAVESGRPEAVEVRYVAGYGAASDCPKEVRAAILMLIAERFDNPAGGVDIPPGVRRVLNGLETGKVW